MRHLLATLGLVLLGTAVHAQTERGSTLQLPGSRPHPAVVRIFVAEGKSQSIGSGSLIDVRDAYGLVVTNWHVIKDAVGEIWVVFPDGFRSSARVVKHDEDWDLAALSIWRPTAAPLAISSQPPRPGELLSIAGYGSDGVFRLVAGPCTQYVAPSEKHPHEFVELAVTARQGDSGGPIFNRQGELAGVLFGTAGGVTTGSYGGRVKQFIEPLLKAPLPQPATPNAAINGLVSASLPEAAGTMKEVQTLSASPRPAAPLNAIPSDITGGLPREEEAAESTSPVLTYTPFPYRDTPTAIINGEPSTGVETDDVKAWLAMYLGRSPLEQFKAALSVIGFGTLLFWAWRWNRGGVGE